MQLFSIGICIAVLLCIADVLQEMKYKFLYIIYQFVVHGNTKPADWLIKNLQYLAYLIIFFSNLFTLIGLLQQFRSASLADKPLELFVSYPLNSLGILMLIYIYSKKWVISYRGKKASQGR
jgi:hypothetical protein